jgi:beta-ureidopropionase / N-carbamoyl-L-amino-acid hydrolase
MFTVNEPRFLHDLEGLASIGLLSEDEGGGRDRRAFSAAEREARRLFTALADEAGLEVRTDTAGNLSARLVSQLPNASVLLFGSHVDTVPNGGPYDGTLGVMAGLEALRVVQEAEQAFPVTLECIAFTDEEGRYCGLTGSQLLAGTYSREATRRFFDAVNQYPGDVAAMKEFMSGNLSVDSLLEAKRPADDMLAFVELHIEQGPQLEHAGKSIGVVDAIFGRVSCTAVFAGRSDHAGTTPMVLRADALAAAARFIVHMNDFVRTNHAGAVFTCGNVTVAPGADNVVPREARVSVEYRANSSDTLDMIGAEVNSFLRKVTDTSGVAAFKEGEHRLEPRPMHSDVQTAVSESCQALGYSAMTLSSGALHDAHSMAAVVPAGMIFVPSKSGRSHCPDEDTDPADLVAGANVLLQTVVRLASGGIAV